MTWAAEFVTSRPHWRGEQWPIGYSWQLGGQYESQQGSFRSMLLVLSVAVLLVFGVLVAQFRRFLPAIIILSAAPLSLAGAFGLLLLTGTPLNVSSMMGLILLIGLIVKNGIILVDYADIVAARGADRIEALVEAGAVRLRPILMTTLCTLFGLAPLALGLGPGAEMQKPLAIAVIGGLTVSTIITLLFVPTALALVRTSLWWRARETVRGSLLSTSAILRRQPSCWNRIPRE